MNRKLLMIIFFTCLAAGISGTVNAQFWKKKSERKHHKHKEEENRADSSQVKPESEKELRKEHRKKEREERRRERMERKMKHGKKHEKARHETVKKGPLPVVKLNQEPEYPPSTVKSHYRIEVLAPLYLDQLSKNSISGKAAIPDKALPGIAFYEGVQIAADSLKNAGFFIDIYIHDVASAAESAGQLVSAGKLDSADLIIGAVQSRDVPLLADFAKKKHVNFISALSASDGGIKDNPYFTIIEPTLKSHCEKIAEEITKRFPGQKVTILHRNTVVADDNAYKYLVSGTEAKLNFRQLLCNTLPPKDSLRPLFDDGRTNVVIVSVLSLAYADSLLQVLSDDFPNAHFEIYGMPSWNGAKFIRLNDFANQAIHVTYPFSFDPSSEAVQYISRMCRQQFGQKPTDLVFRGYETMFWYANLLKKYGSIFNERYNDVSAAPITKFEVKLHWDNDGKILFNENTHLLLSTYNGGENKAEQPRE